MKYEKPDMEIVQFKWDTVLTLTSLEGDQGGGIQMPTNPNEDLDE